MASERDCVDEVVKHASRPDLSLPEVIALGLLVSSKWDKARTAHPAAAATMTSEEAARFDSFTPNEVSQFREAANRVLTQHMTTYTASVVRRAPDGWWRGFSQGVAAAFAYSLGLALVALIIKLLGSDILTVLKELLA